MNEIFEHAWAKLNISLDVLGLLPNAYHEMRMIMQSVSLHDGVHISLTDDGNIQAYSDLDYLPCGEGNLACRAARIFFQSAGMEGAGAHIRLEKRIPVCAGLGGGSSDAAAVLRGLNRLCGGRFDRTQLETMAEQVGSDVPFCVCGGTSLASGTGTSLSPLPPMPDCGIVICKPPISIRTPELFKNIDSRRSRLHPDTDGIIAALYAGDISGIARRMFNVFEDVLPKNAGDVAALKGMLLDAGALGAVMSGTGSALFGIFPDEDSAREAAGRMRGHCAELFCAAPVGEETIN